MSECYHLPVLFTDEERSRYASWGIKKGKAETPVFILTALIDIAVIVNLIISIVSFLQNHTGFHSFLWIKSDTFADIMYTAALILTLLIVKPIDWFLDFIFRKPQEPRMLHLQPISEGMQYTLCRKKDVLDTGLITWDEWKSSVDPYANQIWIKGECFPIGCNTIESIYPPEHQKRWMDYPSEKVTTTTDLKKIVKNTEGYLSSLLEKQKEAEWERRNPSHPL